LQSIALDGAKTAIPAAKAATLTTATKKAEVKKVTHAKVKAKKAAATAAM
jgi:hypothetical protein